MTQLKELSGPRGLSARELWRFLVARECAADKAAEMFEAHWQWRRKHLPVDWSSLMVKAAAALASGTLWGVGVGSEQLKLVPGRGILLTWHC